MRNQAQTKFEDEIKKLQEAMRKAKARMERALNRHGKRSAAYANAKQEWIATRWRLMKEDGGHVTVLPGEDKAAVRRRLYN